MAATPLAERMRPATLDELVGQDTLQARVVFCEPQLRMATFLQ